MKATGRIVQRLLTNMTYFLRYALIQLIIMYVERILRIKRIHVRILKEIYNQIVNFINNKCIIHSTELCHISINFPLTQLNTHPQNHQSHKLSFLGTS